MPKMKDNAKETDRVEAITRRTEEAVKTHEAAFLKGREWFHVKLRVISNDGQRVIDRSGKSCLPTARGIDRVLLEERNSVVFSVGASHGDAKRVALVTLLYDGISGSAIYSRYDLDESDKATVLVLGDSFSLTYQAFRLVYEYGVGLGWVSSPIFVGEAA